MLHQLHRLFLDHQLAGSLEYFLKLVLNFSGFAFNSLEHLSAEHFIEVLSNFLPGTRARQPRFFASPFFDSVVFANKVFEKDRQLGVAVIKK